MISHVSSAFQKWYVDIVEIGEGLGLLSGKAWGLGSFPKWSDESAEIPGENVTTLFQFWS